MEYKLGDIRRHLAVYKRRASRAAARWRLINPLNRQNSFTKHLHSKEKYFFLSSSKLNFLVLSGEKCPDGAKPHVGAFLFMRTPLWQRIKEKNTVNIIVESVEKAIDFSTLTTIDASIMEKSKDFTTIFAVGHGKVEKRGDFPTLPRLFSTTVMWKAWKIKISHPYHIATTY